MVKKTNLTTSNGCPVAHNQNVQTAGPRGPMLLQDAWFLEKLGGQARLTRLVGR